MNWKMIMKNGWVEKGDDDDDDGSLNLSLLQFREKTCLLKDRFSHFLHVG